MFDDFNTSTDRHAALNIKVRFLEFKIYHNFATAFSKLSASTSYKEISK